MPGNRLMRVRSSVAQVVRSSTTTAATGEGVLLESSVARVLPSIAAAAAAAAVAAKCYCVCDCLATKKMRTRRIYDVHTWY